MKILSWDIGIKNLSYCLLSNESNEINILDWGIINLDDPPIICNGHFKNGNKCNRKATMVNNTCGYCKTHLKSLDNNKDYKMLKKKKKKIEFLKIGTKLIIELDKKFKDIDDLNEILLENQPSLKNPTMKSIQMILYSYFLINCFVPNKIQNILMISATQKNKYCNEYAKNNTSIVKPTTKSSYNNAKKLAILVTKDILENGSDDTNFELFEEHKKKDDLADSYLQGLEYLKKK